MIEVLAELDRLCDEQLAAGNEEARTESLFKARYARARMEARNTTGPNGRQLPEKDADDVATLETEVERFDYGIAKSVTNHVRAARSAAEHRLDILRSINVGVRAAGG